MRILIALLLLTLTSCKCLQYCANPPKEVTRIEYRDTILTGATVTTRITDSIPVPGPERIVYRQGQPYTVIQVVEDSASKAKLHILRDEHGQLIAECEAKTQRLKKANRLEVKTIEVPKPYIPPWVYVVGGIMVAIIIKLTFNK